LPSASYDAFHAGLAHQPEQEVAGLPVLRGQVGAREARRVLGVRGERIGLPKDVVAEAHSCSRSV
jgi:hypothetical protein